MQPDPERLESLEKTLARLTQELVEARRAVAELRAGSPHGGAPAPADPFPPPPVSPAPRPAAAAPRTDGSLEQLVGRYGVLVLAVLTIVMGAGALVSWAIAHGMLGPWIRVALGALLAIVFAGAGMWLRARGSRDFGNALVALGLAVTNVVAWGAGPRLGLIPPLMSLAIADAAAGALAALALLENEEFLFSVGLGGALVAPFVMATGVPRYGMLAAYGIVVLAAAIRTLGDRKWWNAAGVILVGTATYAIGAAGYKSGVPWIDREFNAAFAALICVIALLWERRPVRPRIALFAVATMAVAALLRTGHSPVTGIDAFLAAPDVQIFALAGSVLCFVAARGIDEGERSSTWMLVVIAIPLTFLIAALEPLGPIEGHAGTLTVLAWAVVYGAYSVLEQGPRRIGLMTIAGLLGVLWGYLELRDAFSADISTFVVIAYFAVCGAIAIEQGRSRAIGHLRQIGLGFSVLAALYAISAASDVQQIGLRVGSYLLVGAFLLGVAWWYRGDATAFPRGDG
jgi:uncharacterized membrane protein